MRQHPAGSSGPPGPARDARGPRHELTVHPRVRVGALLLVCAYLAFVAWQSLRPLSVLWVSPANLEPFHTIRSDVEQGPTHALRTIGYGLLRLAPLGVLLPLLGRRLGGGRLDSLGRTVVAGGVVSLVIEWAQSLEPSRVADVDTIILNAVGVALAHCVAYGWLRSITLEPGHHGATAGHARAPAAAIADARPPRRSRHDPDHGPDPDHDHDGLATRDRAAAHGMRGAALSR